MAYSRYFGRLQGRVVEPDYEALREPDASTR